MAGRATRKLLELGADPNPQVSAAERSHPGDNSGANLKSITHRYYLFEVAFVWELTNETIGLPLGCLQGGGNYQKVLRTFT